MDNSAINGFSKLLKARQSCRGFLPDAVPDTVIQQIVSTAQMVPSWCNAQPWQVIVTRGDETERFKSEMEKVVTSGSINSDIAFPARYSGKYLERRRICGWQLYEAVGVEKGDRAGSAKQMLENYRLFGAPHLAVVTTEADLGTYGAVDCGAFISAFMLAGQALGVASIAQAAIAAYSGEVRAFFDIPAHRHIVCGISFGYKDPAHPANGFRTARADVDSVIDWR
jgi:nitroreductase